MTAVQPAVKPFDIEAADQAVGVRPETAVRLMQLAADEEATNEQLQQVIDADPSMAMRTLKLANSALYGMSQRISRIERAITMLGRVTVANLAAATSVEAAFRSIKVDAPGITPGTPWRYSISVAFATDTIVRECQSLSSVARRKLSAEAFVAGLIHDIGTLVQAKQSSKAFAASVNASIKSGIPLVVHERRLIGIDHADIGGRLARHWNLPPELANAVEFHHDPLAAELDFRRIACIIHVAAQLVRKAGIMSYDGDTDMLHLEPAMSQLRMDPRRLDRIVSTLGERLREVPA
ncbi:MAG: HDOD domain-containing protein [Phycisphaerae bacterium]